MTLPTESPILLSILGGIITTLLNGLGATPILVLKKLPKRALDIGLGFAAGVMLAASFTSLIMPAIETSGIMPVIIGIIIGSIAVSLADKVVPHLHAIIGFEGTPTTRLQAIWLFTIAITLHNMPEGLAVGVGFGSGNISKAISLMLAIGFQNIPEGLSIGFSILSLKNTSRYKAFLIAFLSGVVELPLSILGSLGVTYARGILPYAMGFAGGAMIFVVSDEVIPETHRMGHERLASYGLIIGLIIMLSLDLMLG